MSDKNLKSPIFIKKSESKKGSLWHEFSNKRIIKQHGGFDIPEDDLHAIHKFESPIHTAKISSDELNNALSGMEDKIEELKKQERQSLIPPSQTPHEQNSHQGEDKHYNDNASRYSDKDGD